MLLPFDFDPVRHRYLVEGHFCLATSDVVELCGIGDDPESIPKAVRAAAALRGTRLHKAAEKYELGEDWQSEIFQDDMPYMQGYFNFRDEHEIQVLPPMEAKYAYLHDCGIAVGGTIDQRFLYKGNLYINDFKSVYRCYGKALKQKMLAWRLQTQSYREMSEMDEPFMSSVQFSQVRRSVLHLHHKYPKGYFFYEFEQDDADLWRGAVLMAMEKIAAGITPAERVYDLKEALEASNEQSFA